MTLFSHILKANFSFLKINPIKSKGDHRNKGGGHRQKIFETFITCFCGFKMIVLIKQNVFWYRYAQSQFLKNDSKRQVVTMRPKGKPLGKKLKHVFIMKMIVLRKVFNIFKTI